MHIIICSSFCVFNLTLPACRQKFWQSCPHHIKGSEGQFYWFVTKPLLQKSPFVYTYFDCSLLEYQQHCTLYQSVTKPRKYENQIWMSYSPSITDRQIKFTKPVLVIVLHTARFLYLRPQKCKPKKPQMKQAVTGTQSLYHINNTHYKSTPTTDRISMGLWHFVAVKLHFMA